MELRAIRNNILVTNMNFHERKTASGIVLLGDDQKMSGVRPRWAKVIAVGPEQNDIQVGQYVLIEHGRWTRGVDFEGEVVRRVDNDDILLISDEEQYDDTLGQSD